MSMPMRELGATGMRLSVVGFGSWAVGGGGYSFGWGAQDDAASVAAIRHAVESGVNWIDTAPAYGLGHAEEVVAKALESFPDRDRPYLFTKCGVLFDPSKPYERPRRALPPDSMRRELEGSLRRLRTERIDLYLAHWPPDDGTPLEAYWSMMLSFREEGKIGAAGLANHTIEQLEQAEAMGHVDSLQPPFSAIRREAAAELSWCATHEVGAIIYSPMQSGLLTGSFSAERVAALPTDDWRTRAPEFVGDRLPRNLALAEALQAVAKRRGTTTASVAVTWTLAWPGVTGAIVGGRNPEQVDGWLPAGSIRLTDADLDNIARAIETSGAGSGPARPPHQAGEGS